MITAKEAYEVSQSIRNALSLAHEQERKLFKSRCNAYMESIKPVILQEIDSLISTKTKEGCTSCVFNYLDLRHKYVMESPSELTNRVENSFVNFIDIDICDVLKEYGYEIFDPRSGCNEIGISWEFPKAKESV